MALAPPQQLSRRERVRLVPPTADAVAAVALAGLALVETWATAAYEPRIPYVLAALAMTLPLAWRRAAPLLTLVVALAVLIAMDAAGNPLDSAYIMAVLILAFYSVGAHLDRVASVTGWLLGVVLIGVLVAIEDGVGAGDFVFVGTIVTAAWVLATAVHRRTEQTAELEGRAARFEQEREVRAREAVADERARIARELHDIVAHSLSIVVVQTAAVRRRLRGDRPSEAETLDKVEAITRDALQEMRRLLGILRSEEDPVPGAAAGDA
jgi:signal transduction histidine kinase